jgi:hypothetical protein
MGLWTCGSRGRRDSFELSFKFEPNRTRPSCVHSRFRALERNSERVKVHQTCKLIFNFRNVGTCGEWRARVAWALTRTARTPRG